MARKWYHPNITGDFSVDLLMQHPPGSFLVRPSQSQQGDYALSVRRADDVTHIKIQNSGDYLDLYGGEKFANLTELVEHYMRHKGDLKEVNGNVIELVQPVICEDPTSERWFHGSISGSDSEKALLDRGEHGSFLVRASQSRPGLFVLSVRCKDRVSHVMIRNKKNRFDVGGGQAFSDLPSLVANYKRNPIVESDGNVIHLLKPFNATSLNLASIAARFDELSKETDEAYGKAGFNEEFEQLQTLEHEHKHDKTEGQRPENKPKNRYKNILPYDYNRVRLQNIGSEVGADYINASRIDGQTEGTKGKYIASQGCMKNTVASFWQMIYENNCRVVVMTTNPEEKGKHKCDVYWPLSDARPARFGDYTINMINEDVYDAYTVRRLEVTQGTGEPREVYQYHYTSWPDHGVPPEREFLKLIITIRKHFARIKSVFPSVGPILVHCSAGIGRTGTFLVIDMVLDLIEKEGMDVEIDIQNIIHVMRGQRSGFIQTASQYRFIYKAIMDYLARNKGRK